MLKRLYLTLLRHYFAAHAMNAFLITGAGKPKFEGETKGQVASRNAYVMAGYMIEEAYKSRKEDDDA